MRHIGILAHSFEGAALCYRDDVPRRRARGSARTCIPEITLTGIAMHYMMRCL